jgi:hypothetical protein
LKKLAAIQEEEDEYIVESEEEDVFENL